METERKEIIICLGSSCFARGNKQLVKIITDYLRNRNLLSEVKFHGERCFGHCAKGPVLKINEAIHEKVDEEKVQAYLDQFFTDLIEQAHLK